MKLVMMNSSKNESTISKNRNTKLTPDIIPDITQVITSKNNPNKVDIINFSEISFWRKKWYKD